MDSRQETSGMTADNLVLKTPNHYYVILKVFDRGSRTFNNMDSRQETSGMTADRLVHKLNSSVTR
jgi:hypothetical protein